MCQSGDSFYLLVLCIYYAWPQRPYRHQHSSLWARRHDRSLKSQVFLPGSALDQHWCGHYGFLTRILWNVQRNMTSHCSWEHSTFKFAIKLANRHDYKSIWTVCCQIMLQNGALWQQSIICSNTPTPHRVLLCQVPNLILQRCYCSCSNSTLSFYKAETILLSTLKIQRHSSQHWPAQHDVYTSVQKL